MNLRLKPLQVALAVIVLCAASVGLLHWRRVTGKYSDQQLFDCLPHNPGTVRVFVSLERLRDSGLLSVLSSSTAAQEPDYTSFVQETGFEYMTDLDAAAVNFDKDDVYATVRGRFNWKRLSDYAAKRGGECRNTTCTIPASKPERFISYFPLRDDVMALAVTREERGVVSIAPPGHSPEIPTSPVWVQAPGQAFAHLSWSPSGAQFLVSSLAKANLATFEISVAANAFNLGLRAQMPTPTAAADATQSFRQATSIFSKMLDRDRISANPADLSGLLVGGAFKVEGNDVLGTWPLDKRFLQAFLGGRLP